jgi:cytoskeleton protein RodZ
VPEIGATLREARMRAHIDVSEIEAKTKIRAKYLRALENEEWGLLPGPTFVKSFLRTYAQALELDAKSLVEEYRLHHEGPSESALEPIVSTSHRASRPRSSGSSRPRGAPSPRPRRLAGARGGGEQSSSRGYAIAVAVIGAVIVLLVVLLIAGGSGTGGPSSTTGAGARAGAAHGHGHAGTAGARGLGRAGGRPVTDVVALSFKATALVYVCLLGDDGRMLIPGTELQPGESTPTYHAKRFQMTLGNSAVTMYVDGRPREVAPSSQAIGYTLTKARGRQPLAPGELPTCR